MGDLAKPGNKEKLSVKAAFGFIELTLNATSLTVIGFFFFEAEILLVKGKLYVKT